MRGKKRRDWIPCGGQFIQQTALKTNTSLVGRIAKRVLISAAKNAERVHLETCLWPVSMNYTGVNWVAVVSASFKQRGKNGGGRGGGWWVPIPAPFQLFPRVTCASLALREPITGTSNFHVLASHFITSLFLERFWREFKITSQRNLKT